MASRPVALPRRSPGRATAVVAAGVLAAALAACGSNRSDEAGSSPRTSATLAPSTSSATATPNASATPASVPPTPSAEAPTKASPTTGAAPAFAASVSAVTAADLGASYRAGCPVGPASLRAITMSYWGFDGQPHTGVLVVHVSVVTQVEAIFKRLYDARFPIRSMRPTSEFGGSDPASMDADNTSAFNCRNAVASGPPKWSVHAYGKAIDVNTVENPYVFNGSVLPAAGAAYTNRSNVRPGMAVRGGVLNNAFAASGWLWGGRWSDPDYQHFSADGG